MNQLAVPPKTHPTLMFIDDEADTLTSLKRLFQPIGYNVLTAASGSEGLALMEKEPVDLVISDMRMPQMSGAEVLEQVRMRWPEVVRILLTGYADLDSTIAAINRGEIYRYISKPWNDDDITLIVRDALRQLTTQLENDTQHTTQLLELNKQLSQAQSHLLQSEKMASVGLLAAGVAHEINNPIGYVNSNLSTLEKYLANIFALLTRYEQAEALMQGHELEELRQFKNKIDLAYLRDDTKSLLAESQQGLERVKEIVLDLKEFSHTGAKEQWAWADIQQGLESTLSIVSNELKYKCEVKKEYATLPQIYCLPSQLNQVFMNLLVNAAQAIEERGVVTLRTGQENDQVWVEVADTGKGIPEEDMPHLFDPFFTTKPVGVGTGLGLSVSYSIVQKHHGRIEVKSEVGKGTAFRVWLPVEHPAH